MTSDEPVSHVSALTHADSLPELIFLTLAGAGTDRNLALSENQTTYTNISRFRNNSKYI